MDDGDGHLANLLPPGYTQISKHTLDLFLDAVCFTASGIYICRDLDQARQIAIDGLTYGRARIGIGPRGEETYNVGQIWEFPSYRAALRAWATFGPEQQEPAGWDRQPDSGRYRLGGDPRCEFWKDADHQLHAVGPDVEIVNHEPRRRGDAPALSALDGG